MMFSGLTPTRSELDDFACALSTLPWDELTIVCIGTDRSTGDALGPLVGTALQQAFTAADCAVPVLGDLEHPVHGENLQRKNASIQTPYTLAIDATLGSPHRVGEVHFRSGPLKPGAAVGKRDLGEIGDWSITAAVNVGGFMPYFVLQNTRLSQVMRLARVIAEGITSAALASAQYTKIAATDSRRSQR